MLFLINWNVSSENRVACWNAFGNMSPEDDIKDAGEGIKIHGRWHHLSGSGGSCIAECNDAANLNSWMLNWAPLCDISVTPVVEDATARESLRGKPYFNASSVNNSSESSESSESPDSSESASHPE